MPVQLGSHAVRFPGSVGLLPPVAHRHIVVLLLTTLAITIALMALSPAYGVTFDESRRHRNGVEVLEFYSGSRTYDAFKEDNSGAHLYGALFDLTAAWLHRQFGGDVWITRHALNAAFGGLGILATGLLALRVAGPGGGLIAVMLLATSPRYIGDSMNNPKDLPFAAMCAFALLSFAALRKEPPFLSWPRAAIVGLSIGLALAVRPGALLYVGYLGLLLAALAAYARAWSPRDLLGTLGRVALVAVVTLAVGTLFWPWAQLNPLVRPVRAFFEISRFEWHGHVLFAGQFPLASSLPWTYLPTWMAITIPPVVLAGLAFALGQTLRCHGVERGWRVVLWGVAATPIAAAIARGSTLYDGWRHVLFVYPPLVVLAASGWRDVLAGTARWPIVFAVTLGALGVGCLEPLRFMVRSHPNEIVYFNALVGGPRGAFGEYEMDYWGNSLLQAAEWSAGLARCAGMPLMVSGWPYPLVRADAQRFPSLVAVRPERGQHHLYVRLLRMSPQALDTLMQRGDALHVVRTADGAPLAVVTRGPRFDDVLPAVAPHLRQDSP